MNYGFTLCTMNTYTVLLAIQTKPFCGFVVIFVVIGDGTGSFKTVNLEVFKGAHTSGYAVRPHKSINCCYGR